MPGQPPAAVTIPPRAPVRPVAPAHSSPFPGYPAATSLPVRTSGLAVASLICALFGLCTVLLALPAVIMAHVALAHMRRDPFLRGRASARAALVLGYATLMLVGLAVVTAWLGL